MGARLTRQTSVGVGGVVDQHQEGSDQRSRPLNANYCLVYKQMPKDFRQSMAERERWQCVVTGVHSVGLMTSALSSLCITLLNTCRTQHFASACAQLLDSYQVCARRGQNWGKAWEVPRDIPRVSQCSCKFDVCNCSRVTTRRAFKY